MLTGDHSTIKIKMQNRNKVFKFKIIKYLVPRMICSKIKYNIILREIFNSSKHNNKEVNHCKVAYKGIK